MKAFKMLQKMFRNFERGLEEHKFALDFIDALEVGVKHFQPVIQRTNHGYLATFDWEKEYTSFGTERMKYVPCVIKVILTDNRKEIRISNKESQHEICVFRNRKGKWFRVPRLCSYAYDNHMQGIIKKVKETEEYKEPIY